MINDFPYTAVQEALIAHLRYPKGYFWRWSEEGVAEWQNGTTIAYAAELMPMLAGLAPDGLPPLGAVLLIMAACNEGWQAPGAELGLLQGVIQNLLPPTGRPTTDELRYKLRVAGSVLEIIRTLPAELRTGRAKLLLLRELLQAEDSLPPNLPIEELADNRSETGLMLYTEEFVSAMRELGQHPPTLELLTIPSSPVTRSEVQTDLLFFDQALHRFPTVHSLELHLRTGLTALPEPLPLDLPTPPADAEPAPTDLLAELAQDARTVGLARLAQRLAALLHLPQHAEGAGSMPLGGVADVTNRGSFDRLLLSELAQDDLSLTARLVHGEALYLRREEPPAPQPPPRAILVDTTIQLWGEPRVFALAAALAVAHPARPTRQQPRVVAYALGGTHTQPLNLLTKAGVTEALGYLDPALHCGATLHTLLREPSAVPTDYLLITEAEAATHPEFSRHLAQAAPSLRFLLTVARTGELAFYEFRQGRRTLLSTLQVDLEELLFATLPITQSPGRELGDLVAPAFLTSQSSPLRFPTTAFQPRAQNAWYDPTLRLVGVTQNRRLLHWPQFRVGAHELLPHVEPGRYHVGFDGFSTIYLLVTGFSNSLLKLYTIPTLTPNQFSSVDLSDKLPTLGADDIAFAGKRDDWCFYLRVPAGVAVLHCPTGNLLAAEALPFPGAGPAAANTTAGLRQHVNHGYNVLQRITQLGISETGKLTVGEHALHGAAEVLHLLGNQSALNKAHTVKPDEHLYPLSVNRLLRFQRAVWPDGSEAITDSRGLLHLRSANAALPEITLVLVLGKSTAAWANDGPYGVVCGSEYFTKNSLAPRITVSEFYQQYIQPFIDHIVAHEAQSASA